MNLYSQYEINKMRKRKKLAIAFFVAVLIISHVMCVHVAFVYCDMLWGIEHAGYSAPAYTAFLLAIPYLIGIAVLSVSTIILWRKPR